MTRHLPERDGLLQLERTGPFVPPISFPAADVVVTHAMRTSIESSTLTGIVEYRPVIKARIVNVDWQSWDQSLELPPILPRSSEPEGYILESSHDLRLAQEIGPLWQVLPLRWGNACRKLIKMPRTYVTTFVGDGNSGPDIFVPRGTQLVAVNDRAREWLMSTVSQFVDFEPMSPPGD
jgi:hypothetical protein